MHTYVFTARTMAIVRMKGHTKHVDVKQCVLLLKSLLTLLSSALKAKLTDLSRYNIPKWENICQMTTKYTKRL
jgi:hypothetical protein